MTFLLIDERGGSNFQYSSWMGGGSFLDYQNYTRLILLPFFWKLNKWEMSYKYFPSILFSKNVKQASKFILNILITPVSGESTNVSVHRCHSCLISDLNEKKYAIFILSSFRHMKLILKGIQLQLNRSRVKSMFFWPKYEQHTGTDIFKI